MSSMMQNQTNLSAAALNADGTSTAVPGVISVSEAMALVRLNGRNQAYLIRGVPGIGKTQLCVQLAASMTYGPNRLSYSAAVIDCATLDIGELSTPFYVDCTREDGEEIKVTSFAPNMRFRFHEKNPVLVILDELPKANPIAMNSLLPLLTDQRIGDFKLPEGSIVVALGNRDEDGLGDFIPGHIYNRVTELMVHGPSFDEWMAWALNAGVHPAMVAFVKSNPAVMQEYYTFDQASRNPFVFDPRHDQVKRFCSPRSMTRAAAHIEARMSGAISRNTFLCAVNGALGGDAGHALETFINMGSSLPTLDDIRNDMNTAVAKVLDAPGVLLLLPGQLMAMIKTEADVNTVMGFLDALDNEEATTLFVTMAYASRAILEIAQGSQVFLRRSAAFGALLQSIQASSATKTS